MSTNEERLRHAAARIYEIAAALRTTNAFRGIQLAEIASELEAALAALPEASEPPLEKYFRDRFHTEWTPELEQELLEKIAAKQKAAPLAQQHTHTPEDK